MLSSTQPPPNPSTDKYEAILEQAIRTFAEVGFRNADVQVIADKAGVGKGTVYRYFGNKEDLFWAACFAVLERLEKHVIAASEGPQEALPTLRRVGLAYAAFFETNPHYLDVFVQNRAEFRGDVPESHKQFQENLMRVFTDVIQRGIDEGEIRPVDPRKAITSLGSVMYGTVNFACYVKDRYTLTELAEHTLDIFLDGIRQNRPGGESSADQ